MKFIRLQKGRAAKSKALELFLFTDMLMYAKPAKAKKKDTTFTVYKQVGYVLKHSGYCMKAESEGP